LPSSNPTSRLPLVCQHYDINNNGKIDGKELTKAVKDCLLNKIIRQQLEKVTTCYNEAFRQKLAQKI
jgi:Ca2+-binding EF-hand superfamily protein